ncbi:hypothetical protein CTA2_3754 [Colletotrichum tanaceti]|uniref:Uncharacterized protein n=1 Tax=Colletotrichum tanaceti TaxID=1306861 RepID=A0A4U6X6V9_9PEZI|nr:hypothetical protein CTA2_3754 [Colletotrichum tanaceti]TKW51188.1 hypothetical protein CTA1_1501 [Colletotrichum tanaceti]
MSYTIRAAPAASKDSHVEKRHKRAVLLAQLHMVAKDVGKVVRRHEDGGGALGGPVGDVVELARDPPEADVDATVVQLLDVEEQRLPEVAVLDGRASRQLPALPDPCGGPARRAVDDVGRIRGDDDAPEPLALPSPVTERRDDGAQLGAVARVAVGLAVRAAVLELESDTAALVVDVGRFEKDAAAAAGVGGTVVEAGAVRVDQTLGAVVAVDEALDVGFDPDAAAGGEEFSGRYGLLPPLAESGGEHGAGVLGLLGGLEDHIRGLGVGGFGLHYMKTTMNIGIRSGFVGGFDQAQGLIGSVPIVRVVEAEVETTFAAGHQLVKRANGHASPVGQLHAVDLLWPGHGAQRSSGQLFPRLDVCRIIGGKVLCIDTGFLFCTRIDG